MNLNSVEKAVFDYLEKKQAKAGNYFWVSRGNGQLPNLFRGDLRGLGRSPKHSIETDFWVWDNIQIDKHPDALRSNDIYFCIRAVGNKTKYKFEIYLRYCVSEVSQTPLGKARQKFIDNILKSIKKKEEGCRFIIENKNHKGCLDAHIYFPCELEDIESLIKAYDKTLNVFIPVIDKAMRKTKNEYPKWKSRRLTKEEYETFLKNRLERIKNNNKR